jgi:hypothetical protein
MSVHERIQKELSRRLSDGSAGRPSQKRDDARKTDRVSVAESIQRELESGEVDRPENSESAPAGNRPQMRRAQRSSELAIESFLDQERKTPAYKQLTKTERRVFEKSVREQLEARPPGKGRQSATLGDATEDLRSGMRRQRAIVTNALTEARAVR